MDVEEPRRAARRGSSTSRPVSWAPPLANGGVSRRTSSDRRGHGLPRSPRSGPRPVSAPVWSPPVWSPPVWSPPVWSPPVWSPPVWSPPVWSPPVWSPPVWSPPVWSPPVWSPPVWSPPTWSPPTWSPPARGCHPTFIVQREQRRAKVERGSVDNPGRRHPRRHTGGATRPQHDYETEPKGARLLEGGGSCDRPWRSGGEHVGRDVGLGAGDALVHRALVGHGEQAPYTAGDGVLGQRWVGELPELLQRRLLVL
ncbi:hypothetical protein FB559_7027 [Actinoallomurus bryophytorum]|uniref:Uncharacterized protein n=1 Tax=Actinoallomurus bryophytorum TaxID=1490222 RepID=A0A543CVY9_9ACTN|nr:hypothetical protein FB559_7027 [Actinoallomurus bryophytorum]